MVKTLLAVCSAALLLATTATMVVATPAAAAATEPLATWQLDEPAGARTMLDSSGNGFDGAIGGEVVTGATFDGATGYRFERLRPNTPPPRPEHIVRVPHDPRLNPGDADFSVEIRYRTGNPFGNLIQKGQSGARGGYWKIQLPQGEPSCLFRGGSGVTNAVRSTIAIDDEQWHTIRCDRTRDTVELYVDGVFGGRNRGLTGSIANNADIYFGGKGDCDQVEVTCDYFGGDVDWVRLTTGAAPTSSPPTASFDQTCVDLTCELDGSASFDPDGPIAAYAWEFGDGGRDVGARPTHTFAAAGTYAVQLTVTDGSGRTGSTTRQVTVTAAVPGIAFREATTGGGNSSRPVIAIPVGVAPGDTMLLFLSVNRSTTITDPTGWTAVGTQNDGTAVATRVWRKVADGGDPGRTVSLTLGATAKYAAVVAAYAGVDPDSPVIATASAAEQVFRATHTTPAVASEQPSGSRLVSIWSDKSNTTSDWSAPQGEAQRAEVVGTSGAGRVSALLTDALGGTGGVTATADTASSQAVTWSILLRPAS